MKLDPIPAPASKRFSLSCLKLKESVQLLQGRFSCAAAEDPYMTRALQLMSETPLIDGHNDLPWQLRIRFNNELNKVDLNTLDTTHTNIPKIKEGRLGAQFWSAFVPCDSQYKDAVRQTLEQIDVVHRMCQKYPETFMFATSSHGETIVISETAASSTHTCL
ncbi:dipeptidase 1 (renal) [Dissostichus eleginoides]|nr:dipeptidase 1 (renal) [Dissostichus eleginoides]